MEPGASAGRESYGPRTPARTVQTAPVVDPRLRGVTSSAACPGDRRPRSGRQWPPGGSRGIPLRARLSEINPRLARVVVRRLIAVTLQLDATAIVKCLRRGVAGEPAPVC